MDILLSCLVLIIMTTLDLEAGMFHRTDCTEEKWVVEDTAPFNELMLTWNAARPMEGCFLFYISVKTHEWSPWFLYASWGGIGQSSFHDAIEDADVQVFQDSLEIVNGKKATAFSVKVIFEGRASWDDIRSLHVYTKSDQNGRQTELETHLSSILLEVPGISQMALNHLRNTDLCSPTSTTAVVRYLSHDQTIDAVDFAQKSWDAGFDIYGNWVFNVAQASTHLGPEWDCWVERLDGFEDLYRSLAEGIPVIISIRGPLEGSAQPYAKGHLIAVIGYDALNQQMICMDPAFPSDEETRVPYNRSDLMKAWSRRGNVAYKFRRKSYSTFETAS
jgi:hypothetical protein